MERIARRGSDPGRASDETNLKPFASARENNGARFFIAIFLRWQREGDGGPRHVRTDLDGFTTAIVRSRRAFVEAYYADDAGRLRYVVQRHFLRRKALACAGAKHLWQCQQPDNAGLLLRQYRCTQERDGRYDGQVFHIQELSADRLAKRKSAGR